MNISLEELNPFIDPLDINGIHLQTKGFDLYCEVWAAKHFENFTTFIDLVMNGESVAIYSGIYTTLIDKNVSYSQFVKTMLAQKDAKKTLGILATHLTFLIKNAQPLIKNPKRLKEINAALGKEEGDHSHEGNYAVFFDKIARRYGYSFKDFYTLTSRQLHACFKAMETEDYKELEVRAALAGRKLKEQIKYHDFTEEQEAEHIDQAEAAIERHKERMKKAKENGSGN